MMMMMMIANPPNSAQLGGTLTISPKLHPGPCSSSGMRPRTDRQTDTHAQTRVTTIHFASSTTHTKCKRHRASRSMYSLTFRVRVMLSYSNATRAPIANPPDSAQLGGIPYHSPKLHPGPCNSAGMRPRTDTDTRARARTRVTTIHFASSTTHAKCNDRFCSTALNAVQPKRFGVGDSVNKLSDVSVIPRLHDTTG